MQVKTKKQERKMKGCDWMIGKVYANPLSLLHTEADWMLNTKGRALLVRNTLLFTLCSHFILPSYSFIYVLIIIFDI